MPREGHDRSLSCFTPHQQQFQSTCPARGTTFTPITDFSAQNFNPRAPRGARHWLFVEAYKTLDISIHVPREGHDLAWFNHMFFPLFISIHVPREGHDVVVIARSGRRAVISIHVPREGHDQTKLRVCDVVYQFQSTCPARGTTGPRLPHLRRLRYFNPRAPRGARPHNVGKVAVGIIFQSTCPARGTTSWSCRSRRRMLYFNPRAPRGARLGGAAVIVPDFIISIHVPREGHDQACDLVLRQEIKFQSTCPARGTTN